MERVNIKVATFSVLSGISEIKKVVTDYPSTWNDFPTAIYRTVNNPHFVDGSGEELQTKWSVTIELYSKSSLTTIVNNVIEQFGDIGFTGTQRDANTADLKRVIIELSAIVDNKTKYVYSK
ncbi:hypothetical protein [Lactococcus lactis]|uniref:hypothetical protein n=1 Tax=Lactococcus lactis TaxID=1358 RepID=UPI0004949627|nr:hypothetical protein [Lactococcus lactis]